MHLLASVAPTLKLVRRLSCNSNVRRYTFLTKVLEVQRRSLVLPNIALKRYYCANKTEKTENGLGKLIDVAKLKGRALQDSQTNEPNGSHNVIMPMPLLDLNPQSSESTMVLLIPFSWQGADYKSIGKIITSLYNKNCSHIRQIEAFSEALREVPNVREVSEKEAQKIEAREKEEISKELLNFHQSSELDNPSSSLVPITDNSMDYLDRLAAAIEKSLQQCCLHSMQMSVDAKIFETTIKGLRFPSTPLENVYGQANDEINLNLKNKTTPLSLSTIMQIDASKLNLEEISWNKSYPFSETLTSSLTNITFPINITRKSYSTRSTNSGQQNGKRPTFRSKPFGDEDSSIKIISASELSNLTDMTPKRNVSNTTTPKSIANYDFPFLSNLFGTKVQLLSSDAYNKALIEAARRRAALTKCAAELKTIKNLVPNRPMVTKVKGCNEPSYEQISDTHVQLNLSSTSEKLDIIQAKGSGCGTHDPSKPPECPNPCKEEMEKLKQIKEREAKRKNKKTPTGCVSPKCKKDDGCTKFKKSPCKKASAANISSSSTLQFAKGDANDKKTKSKNIKNKKNPCGDDHKDYKPKCNPDPCKDSNSSGKKSPPCGDFKKKEDKKKEDPCKKKKSEDKKKEDPCKQKSESDKKKEDPCKKKKSDPCGGDKKKEDPCKKKKSDPCGGDKKKEDPCKTKKSDPCASGKKKEDPCKKKSGSDKKKEDSCKKKSESDKKKSDPCASDKKKKCDPCENSKKKKDEKKDDPCKNKDDPNKKKCSSDSKKFDSKKKAKVPCGRLHRATKPNCNKKSKSFSTLVANSIVRLHKSTKPNCGKKSKSFSTLAINSIGTTSETKKRTFTSFSHFPLLKNKNMNSFMRHYSSKGGKKDKNKGNLGRNSTCKSLAAVIPQKRTPAFNPHPKDGLRKCYDTYDMDCRKLCKDPRETSCKKFAFLKNTDNNKRNGKK